MNEFEIRIRAAIEGIEWIERDFSTGPWKPLSQAKLGVLSDSLARVLFDILDAVQVIDPALAERLENETKGGE